MSDGSPVEGVSAVLYTGLRPMSYDTTDSRGQVRFRFVPPDGYGVLIDLPTGLIHTTPGVPFAYRDDLAVQAGEETTVEFVLSSAGIGAVEAEVLDSALRPIEGVTLAVYTFRDVVKTIQTDSLGVARADSLPIDNYGVSMVIPDSTGGLTGPLLFEDSFVLSPAITPRVRFVIPACRGDVEVTVRDQANQPIGGMTVTRYNANGTMGTRITTTDGRARFRGVLCGPQGLRLEPRNGFTISAIRGSGFDEAYLSRGDTARVTLRATRN
jgi:hypothetical protein